LTGPAFSVAPDQLVESVANPKRVVEAEVLSKQCAVERVRWVLAEVHELRQQLAVVLIEPDKYTNDVVYLLLPAVANASIVLRIVLRGH